MWAVALVYFGLLLLTFCVCGGIAEKYLLRETPVAQQVAEDTCEEHRVYLCEECFPVAGWKVDRLCGDRECLDLDHLRLVPRKSH